MEAIDYPVLSFACEFDDLTAADVEEKGFFDHAIVTLEDGCRYRLHFYDPDRLAVDLKTDLRFGKACIAEPGLVIVPKVTPQNMKDAAKQLVKEGYFASLNPMSEQM